LKILVAEDEPEILRIYQLLFAEKGYQVIATRDGRECLEAYKSELNKITDNDPPFDLVLLDYRMPEKNGIEVAKQILRMRSDQKILMVTAYKDQFELKDKDLEKMNIMEKPFDIDELLSTISQLGKQTSILNHNH